MSTPREKRFLAIAAHSPTIAQERGVTFKQPRDPRQPITAIDPIIKRQKMAKILMEKV